MQFSLHRRWFSFSLRTLFAVVTIFAIWLGWNVHQVRLRAAMISQIKADGGDVLLTSSSLAPKSGSLPFSWRLEGARPVFIVSLEKDYEQAELARIEQLFPEALVIPYIVDNGPIISLPTAEDWERMTAHRKAQRAK